MSLNIVFLDRASLPVVVRRPNVDHQWFEYDASTAADVIARCAEADIIISNKVRIDAEAIAALPRLKLIAIAATGTNNVDLVASKQHGVAVCNIQHYAGTSVPEHALMLMLALMRNLPAYQQDLRAGAWQQSPHFCHFGAPIRDLSGRQLLIIGAGSLGQATAHLARAFGMHVAFAEHKHATTIRPGYIAFEAGLQAADIVSLHCPLNDTTKLMISEAEFAMMKHDALLINTARGGIVDEAALLNALERHTLAGAGIDVLHEEPPRTGNALLNYAKPNLIITPHVGWASFEAMSRLAEQLICNIEAWQAGKPNNLQTQQ